MNHTSTSDEFSFTSPVGRGRIAFAIRVRGYGLTIDRTPFTPTLSPWERERTSVNRNVWKAGWGGGPSPPCLLTRLTDRRIRRGRRCWDRRPLRAVRKAISDIARGGPAGLGALDQACRGCRRAFADHALDAITWLPPIPAPEKIHLHRRQLSGPQCRI